MHSTLRVIVTSHDTMSRWVGCIDTDGSYIFPLHRMVFHQLSLGLNTLLGICLAA